MNIYKILKPQIKENSDLFIFIFIFHIFKLWEYDNAFKKSWKI